MCVQDYPSVGQIAQMLDEKEVSVIFAVTNDRLNTYRVRLILASVGLFEYCVAIHRA